VAADRVDRDLHHAMEFIMRVKPFYREDDLAKKGFLTFFTMLDECERMEREAVERMEKARD